MNCQDLDTFTQESLFYIGGFAILTLMINGTTTGALLRYLGMMKSEEAAKALLYNARTAINQKCHVVLDRAAQNLYGRELSADDKAEVEERASVLRHKNLPDVVSLTCKNLPDEEVAKRIDVKDDSQKAITLLYYRILRNEYMNQNEMGIMSELLAVVLLESADQVIEQLKAVKLPSIYAEQPCADDLDFLNSCFLVNKRLTKCIRPCSRRCGKVEVLVGGEIVSEKERKTYHAWALLSYVIAHRSARKQVTELLQATDEAQASELMSKALVLRSAEDSIEEAVRLLQTMGESFVHQVKVWQVTGMVFHEQRRMIERSLEAGLLDDNQAHELLHELEHDEEHSYWMPLKAVVSEEEGDAAARERAVTHNLDSAIPTLDVIIGHSSVGMPRPSASSDEHGAGTSHPSENIIRKSWP